MYWFSLSRSLSLSLSFSLLFIENSIGLIGISGKCQFKWMYPCVYVNLLTKLCFIGENMFLMSAVYACVCVCVDFTLCECCVSFIILCANLTNHLLFYYYCEKEDEFRPGLFALPKLIQISSPHTIKKSYCKRARKKTTIKLYKTKIFIEPIKSTNK